MRKGEVIVSRALRESMEGHRARLDVEDLGRLLHGAPVHQELQDLALAGLRAAARSLANGSRAQLGDSMHRPMSRERRPASNSP